MNYIERQQVAKEGVRLLEIGTFPNELIEVLTDKRERKDLSNQIFYPKGSKKPNELNETEKKQRRRRLKVELSFIKYMAGIQSAKKAAYIMTVIGVFFLALSVTFNNGNISISVITILEGVLMFLFSMDLLRIVSHIRIMAFVLFGLLVIEMIVFGIPNEFFSSIGHDVLASRRGAILKLFNALSPFLYLVSKAAVIGTLFYSFTVIEQFIEDKRAFELKN